ncbi:MAG: NADPH-dependent glutamate synthase [Candidatus Lokiarchaeota archaeon]|nr:NADPH-dependent glutamate synthase [Candidatus Lokiarchaeota archaeon]
MTSVLVNILEYNKDKIIKNGKYTEETFQTFIESLKVAEEKREQIRNKILEIGKFDEERLANETGFSSQELLLNVEYLSELGVLEKANIKPNVFKKQGKLSKVEGTFPTIAMVRDANLCCACGLCVSTCPLSAIKYNGDTLELDEDICVNCGLCYACCPRTFFPKTLKTHEGFPERGSKYLPALNSFSSVYTARTTEESLKDQIQDGGIVTTLLLTAFKEKLINAALTVESSDKPLEPRPVIIESENDLIKTSGTKYANAHSLSVLNSIQKYDRIAVVGTPCMMEALEKSTYYPLGKSTYDNIVYKIGLFCMESFDYESIVDLVKKEFKKNPEDVKKMDINKGRMFVISKNNEVSDIPLKQAHAYPRLGCFFCDDLTAEQADISVGSIGSDPGWSTVIVRTQKGADLFKKALELHLVEKKELDEENKNFKALSRIAGFKLKNYKEIERIKMKEQPPEERVKNFEEVPFGYTSEMAIKEAERCLQCNNPQCVKSCPVNIDIPAFIKQIKAGKFQEAIATIKDYNVLPAVCGRVCPQEVQCEGACLLGECYEPVAIGNLERFVADWERQSAVRSCPECKVPNGRKVAVIGSGPAGLTVAADMARQGYEVTVFEAFHKGGGVLVYGIPEFRLPKAIVAEEINTLKDMGVKFVYNAIIGKILTIEDLQEMGFEAFFVAVGAGLPIMMKMPGLELNGVLSANEFLTRTNLMKAYKFPEYDTPIKIGKNVAVVGGGNVAMDSARVALRLGAEKVYLIYRRSEAEMPARKEEYHHGKEEGIKFTFLTNPVRIIGDDNGNVSKLEVIKQELGEPDDSGRRSPKPIHGSEYQIDVDLVILAIGTRANPILTSSYPKLEINKWGYISTDDLGKTNLDYMYAGGDIVTGAATVISAMGAGRKAAKGLLMYFNNHEE